MFHRLLLLALPLTLHAEPIRIETLVSSLRDPIEFTITPEGDMLVVEREGRVLRFRPSTGHLAEIGKIEVTALRENDPDSGWAREDGILGITLDPDFATNQRLYIYYSHPTELLNRLSRFQLQGGLLDMASEKVLLDIPTDRRDRVCHHGGSLSFGPDGLLYLSVGDNTNPFESDGKSPLDDRSGREHTNAMRSAGNTNDLRGKILRIRPTEDGYEIPPGNLFPKGTPKTRPEIYVMGCRNPYRISIDPETNLLYWGEVGPDAQGPDDHGPAGHDEVNQARAAGNFGWPFVIADNQPYPILDFAADRKVISETDPAKPRNPSVSNTGIEVLPPAQPAFIWYPYAESKEFPELGSGGRNAMAGPVFYHDAGREFNLLPKSDNHSLIVYEWARGLILKAELDSKENLRSLEKIASGLVHPMDMEMEDNGMFWLLGYGSNWWFSQDGTISRMVSSSLPEAPQIEIQRKSEAAGTWTVSKLKPSNATVQWWISVGSGEQMIGEGKSITLPAGANATELRAVALGKDGRNGIARFQLIEENTKTTLELKLAGDPQALGFGETIEFQIAPATPAVVRARYIPPTGHDSGGPQLPADIATLLTERQCFACHQVDTTSVGPRYTDVALRYLDQPDVTEALMAKLKVGGAGAWGEIPMPPQPALTEAEAARILPAILGLADGLSESRGKSEGSLILPAAPAEAAAGGAWEITAEAPGVTTTRLRIPAK